MLVVCVDFEIEPSRLDDFMIAMRQNASQSFANEPGCQQFDICQDPEKPNKIFLYEIYDDMAAFDDHKATRHYDAFQQAVAGMITHKSVRLLNSVSHHS